VNDLCDVLHGCKYLFYADDLKIFKAICNIQEAEEFQKILSRVNEWCTSNKMALNVGKCKVISLTRRSERNKICHSYEINDEEIKRCSVVNDLGVHIDEKLNMNEHINIMATKARRTLGFVKRLSKQINSPYTTKNLYIALVRPILEYCSTVWTPFTKYQIDNIESVQKQFLLFALRHLGWNDPFILPPYLSRLQLLNMESLEKRRMVNSAVFMYKLTNGIIDLKELNEQIMINQSRYETRHRQMLVIRPSINNYMFYSPMQRFMRLYNQFYNSFLTSESVNIFKNQIRSQIVY